MDRRKNNKGTIGNKGGRPPKADEVKLIEALTPLHPEAMKAIATGVKNHEFPFVKLYMEYFYGKPKESVHMDSEMIVKVIKVKRSDVSGTTGE